MDFNIGFSTGSKKGIGKVETKDLPPIDAGMSIALMPAQSVIDNAYTDIFKAYIPNFLYKPPFGYPRRVNTFALKQLAANPYVYSVIKTLADEVSSIKWDVEIKKEYQEGGDNENEWDEKTLKDGIRRAKKFLMNPNGNEESFEQILRKLIWSIMEVDAGVLVKVFNVSGKLKHILVRDGATFLKNPDIYGYIGNRAQFVAPMPDDIVSAYTTETLYEGGGARGRGGYSNQISVGQTVSAGGENVGVNNQNFGQGARQDISPQEQAKKQQEGFTKDSSYTQMLKRYGVLYLQNSAYFQYGNFSASVPVPFGLREILYIMQNPRYDSIYGSSPVEILNTIILSLVYGSEFNLDMYVSANIPDGVITLLGAQQEHIEQFRRNFDNQYRFRDVFGKTRKKFFQFPITSKEVKFTPFNLTSKDMELIAQQQWFIKLVWACFGVTSDEMGFTEDSNKAISAEQTRVFKRKAIKPLLNVLKFHFDTQLIPEFFTDEGGEFPEDCPAEIIFNDYNYEDDLNKHNIVKMKLDMGVITKEMAASELDINVDELRESKEDAMQNAAEMAEKFAPPEEESEDEEIPFPAEKENDKTLATLNKSIDVKAKYIRRTGSSGNYRYYYKEPSKKPSGPSKKPKINKEHDDMVDHVMVESNAARLKEYEQDIEVTIAVLQDKKPPTRTPQKGPKRTKDDEMMEGMMDQVIENSTVSQLERYKKQMRSTINQLESKSTMGPSNQFLEPFEEPYFTGTHLQQLSPISERSTGNFNLYIYGNTEALQDIPYYKGLKEITYYVNQNNGVFVCVDALIKGGYAVQLLLSDPKGESFTLAPAKVKRLDYKEYGTQMQAKTQAIKTMIKLNTAPRINVEIAKIETKALPLDVIGQPEGQVPTEDEIVDSIEGHIDDIREMLNDAVDKMAAEKFKQP